ncbi:hypothetical protein PYCCODRAFT_729214 [Trametes coccinea BRFM310]|uniref:Uncharacterized protein n=1 Tax=Trametes coccinea (strain BRFM310) TaxID=1353009 RepID=A0A1Y2IFZ3_TRAC3|nr:hypothetical protein PYCCODRAFT_729214 [Trametes coccinea BRFM310]
MSHRSFPSTLAQNLTDHVDWTSRIVQLGASGSASVSPRQASVSTMFRWPAESTQLRRAGPTNILFGRSRQMSCIIVSAADIAAEQRGYRYVRSSNASLQACKPLSGRPMLHPSGGVSPKPQVAYEPVRVPRAGLSAVVAVSVRHPRRRRRHRSRPSFWLWQLQSHLAPRWLRAPAPPVDSRSLSVARGRARQLRLGQLGSFV